MKTTPDINNFIDIHSHHSVFEADVFRIHNIFSSEYPYIPANQPFSIGLHPWHINDESVAKLKNVLTEVVSLPNLIAIGETGLDAVIQTPLNRQIEVFRTHIEVSNTFNKPLIVHCVRSFPELFKLRKEYRNPAPWVIHGFNANLSIAAECLKAGIYISYSTRLFRNPEKTRKIAAIYPLNMIFAETDDDSIPIQQVFKNISDLYFLSVEDIQRSIFENYVRIIKPQD